MPRFKGIVRSVTISKDEMQKLLRMPLEEVKNWSPAKVMVLPSMSEVNMTLARTMIDKIKENNAAGKVSTFIIPAGGMANPPGMYRYVVELTLKERISWENVWTFNMDEVLDWTNRAVAEDHPWSFYGSTKKALFDQVGIPLDQVLFPDPQDPDAIGKKIIEMTKGKGVDITFDGIGEHCHVAYDESPGLMTHWTHITPEDFKSAPTRILPHLNPETLTRALRGPLYILAPPGAITIGMKWMLEAKKVMLFGGGSSFRIAAMHPPTMDFPATLFQDHQDITMLTGGGRGPRRRLP